MNAVTTFTPNKGYPLQPVGSNVGRWGTVLNGDFISVLDKNLGSPFEPVLSGNTNYTVSDKDAENIRHNLTGTLTGDVDYILPARGGFYIISNNTTGGFIVTAKPAAGTGIVLSASPSFIFINTDTNAAEIVVGGSPTYPISLGNGGTGVGTAPAARIVFGVDYSDQIEANGSGQLVIVPSAVASALGLGSAAFDDASAFDPAGAAADAQAASLQKDANLGDVDDQDASRTNISAAKSGANADITALNALGIVSTSTNYAVQAGDSTVLVNASGGARTITFNPALGTKEVTIAKTDTSANLVSISDGTNVVGSLAFGPNGAVAQSYRAVSTGSVLWLL